MKINLNSYFSLCFCAFVVLFAFGCGGNQTATTVNENRATISNNANAKPEPPKNPQTPYEKALFTVRVEPFDQVLVFRRRDGGVFTKEDKDFLRENSPNHPGRNVNRWVQCEDEKCFIAGTNFEFTRENLVALQSRFEVKDLSRSDAGEEITLPPATEAPKNENKQ